jgi:hypothetical protein
MAFITTHWFLYDVRLCYLLFHYMLLLSSTHCPSLLYYIVLYLFEELLYLKCLVGTFFKKNLSSFYFLPRLSVLVENHFLY